MSSTGVIVRLCFVLMCLAAELRASAAVSGVAGGNGNLDIPSSDSLAHCPSSCGGFDFSYPFGIGPGCFRQGFELTCDTTTKPPRLFLGNTTTQISDLGIDFVWYPIGFNITMRPGTNTYNESWESPVKGFTIDEPNSLFIVGCGLEVYLFDNDTNNTVGSCMSLCINDWAIMEKFADGGGCGGIGCCVIRLQRELRGFRLTLVHLNGFVQQSDPVPSHVKVFLSYTDYTFHTRDLFSSWVDVQDVRLSGAITDQANCQNASTNQATYACGPNTDCRNQKTGGYRCDCSGGIFGGNPYIIDGL